MKITLEWDNHPEFTECINLANVVTEKIKTRDFLGHIVITNEVD